MSGIIASNIDSNSGLIKKPAAGIWVKISSVTASSSGDVSFTSGIDSTYKEYCFVLNSIHPQTDNKTLSFNFSTDGGSNYNVTKTSTWWQAYNNEAADNNTLTYISGQDLAQSTGFQTLSEGTGNDNDQCYSGYLYLYDPSSTTFVKNFMAVGSDTYFSDFINNIFVGGYGNTTSAIDAVQFKFASGNIDAGTITLYGIN